MGYSLDVTSTKPKGLRQVFDVALAKPGHDQMLEANWGIKSVRDNVNAASHIERANMASLLRELIGVGFGDITDELAEESL